MIRLSDASKLALTKVKTRKIRLVVTTVIAGLLLSGLSAASFVMRGAFSSVQSFSKEGLGERYIVQAVTQGALDSQSNPELNKRAVAIHQELVARKKAEAKRLGIEYDAATDPPPVEEILGSIPKQTFLNPEHPAARQALKENLAIHPLPGRADLEKLAAPYQANGYYQKKSLILGQSNPILKVMKDGKEPLEQDNTQQQFGPPIGTDSFTQSWSLISQDMLKPFTLPDSSYAVGEDGSLPVLAPYSAVEQLLGLKPLSSNAKPPERLERIKAVRAGAPNLKFQVCQRNSASLELVNSAVRVQQEIEQNKNNKEYQRPSLQYGLPKDPCGAVPIIRDVRTPEEKTLADKQEQFDSLFGTEAPAQSIVSFRVIGVLPEPPAFGASVVTGLVSSLVGSSLGYQSYWFTPIELEESTPALKQNFSGDINMMNPYENSPFVEFPSADLAKQFIDKENCNPDFGNISISTGSVGAPGDDPFAECAKQGKVFQLIPYGSNSLALESVKNGFGKFFRVAALVVAIIAAIIMIGTVGRIIADSRRETAVFRAIGAKKFDIAQIYVLYTIILSVLICLFAVVVGYGLSQFIEGRYASEFTLQALVAYNAQDLTKTFKLFAFHGPDMIYLLGLTLFAGLISALFPLLRNLRRNPIRDMRDEN